MENDASVQVGKKSLPVVLAVRCPVKERNMPLGIKVGYRCKKRSVDIALFADVAQVRPCRHPIHRCTSPIAFPIQYCMSILDRKPEEEVLSDFSVKSRHEPYRRSCVADIVVCSSLV